VSASEHAVAAPGAPHRPPWRARVTAIGVNVVLYLFSIAVALAISAALVSLTDASPSDVWDALYTGSLKTGSALGLTIDKTVPILIVALGAVIASRAAIINIGPEGQVLIGGTAGAAVALFVPGPGWLVLALTIVGAGLGGALWAGIAALMRFTRGVDVVISTLLLNFIATEVVSFAVNRTYLLRETSIGGALTVPQSDRIPEDTHLPRLGRFPDFNVHSGVFVAAVLVGLVTVLLLRTRWGFRLRMLGLNESAARRAGVSALAFGGGALLLSGAFAGLAGGVMLTGEVFRVQPGFSAGVGYDGLLVALIARRQPLVTVPVAFFFGMLRSGGGFLASTGVPSYFVAIVQALLVLAALFPPVFLDLARRRAEIRRARASARGGAPARVEVQAA
jgi:simple sugar transport system permease protein